LDCGGRVPRGATAALFRSTLNNQPSPAPSTTDFTDDTDTAKTELEGFVPCWNSVSLRQELLYFSGHHTIMQWLFPPSKKPTPSEYAVLAWFVSIAFIVVGIGAIVMGLRAPESKHDAAVALETHGAWCIGIGLAIAAAYWLYRRLTDY
jgi:hypothetical protein